MPRFWRHPFTIVAYLMAILAAGYGALAWRYWSQPVVLSRNFTAEWNAPILQTPVEQRAWPVYQKVLLQWAEGRTKAAFDDYREVLHDKEAADWIRSHKASIAEARRATHLPRLGGLLSDATTKEDLRVQLRFQSEDSRARRFQDPLRTPSENPQLMSTLLPFIQDVREVGRVLLGEAMTAAQDGDAALAKEDLLAVVSSANQLRESPLLVVELVAFSQYGSALWTWGKLLELYPRLWNDDQLREINDAMRQFDVGDLKRPLAGERDAFLDVVQRTYSDDGAGDGFFRPTDVEAAFGEPVTPKFNVLAPLTTFRFPSRKQTLAQYDEIMRQGEAELALPYWQKKKFASQETIDRLRISQRNSLVGLMALSYESLHLTREGMLQSRDAALTAAALVRYRLRHDRWPTDLPMLVPEFLPELPLDRYTGEPLHYLPSEPQPVLYSVGNDLQDEGGRAAEIESYHRPQPGAELAYEREPWHWNMGRHGTEKGDLILWPVEGAQSKTKVLKQKYDEFGAPIP